MNAKSAKFESFRKRYSTFIYEDFFHSIQNNQIEVIYRFTINNDEIVFSPKITLPKRPFYNFNSLTETQLQILLFNIGMIELVSYWKCTCSPKVLVKPFSLSQEQIDFWKKLYFNGLGEFFYLNKITTSVDDFMNITCSSARTIEKQAFNLRDEVIVPVGGGKDSIVTLEMLLQARENIKPLVINSRGATFECIQTAGFSQEETIEINRVIDPRLLELNEAGFLNGHTPFSAMLAFVSLLCSAVSGRKHIALSNESSANESTVKDSVINHQYSKSLEFEKDFREYVATFISDDFNYFSFLRPLNELQIAKLFSQNNKYFGVFKSCNAGSKTNSWCAKCSKCLFVYCILSPFIEPLQLQKIFSNNLFQDKGLLPVFKQLIGEGEEKPFECVGTIDEINIALQLLLKTYYREVERLPILLDYYQKSIKYELIMDPFNVFDSHNFLNPKFEDILRKYLKISLL